MPGSAGVTRMIFLRRKKTATRAVSLNVVVIKDSNLKTPALVQLFMKIMEMRYQAALIADGCGGSYSKSRRKKTATSAVL